MARELFAKMDLNGDGEIDEKEFTTFFHAALPQERASFDATMDQFMEVIAQSLSSHLPSLIRCCVIVLHVCAVFMCVPYRL